MVAVEKNTENLGNLGNPENLGSLGNPKQLEDIRKLNFLQK